MSTAQSPQRPLRELPPAQRRASALLRSLPLLRAMRPRQWTKNALCIAALIMGGRERDGTADLRMLACVALFCALSGSVYLANDALDVERDRIHPTKKFRPVAAGEISLAGAWGWAAAIGGVGLLLGLGLGVHFFLITLAYMLLQAGYVFFLKHQVLLDVFAIALGYVLRAGAGAVAIGVTISPWLYLCTILGGLFLALGKRRQELIDLEGFAIAHRRNLGQYSVELVDQLITIVAASTVAAYSLYTFSAPNLPRNGAMMATIPFALYGLFRYLYLIHQHGQGGSPEEVLLRDRPLQVCILLWGGTAVAMVGGLFGGTI